MMRWTVTLDLYVAPCWVADGFDASRWVREGQLQERIKTSMLSYAREHEFRVEAKVTREPSPALVAFEVGRCSERINEKPDFSEGPRGRIYGRMMKKADAANRSMAVLAVQGKPS